LLHIPAERKRAEIWTQRQGYDGEEELTTTPLLPDFTINALAARPDGGLYVATNSGLAIIGPQPPSPSKPSKGAQARRSVQLLSEATGWSTDFMNDLALGLDGRLWVATDQGLFTLDQSLKPQLTTPRASMSAVGVDPHTGLIWVAIQDKLYRGDGRFETWERIKLTEGGLSGVIKRVLPFEGASQKQRGTERGVPFVWLATTRELLRGEP
jgi:ligand-binding sensor domain-containing protein